jgi:CysZ protein
VQDPLSEATERALGDTTTAPSGFIRGTLIALRHTLVRLVLMLVGFAVLFPLNFIPAAGSVVWVVVSTLWSAFWLSAEYLSGPMARHHRRFREVLAALKKRPGATFGFGLALWLLLWLPVVNFFLMPLAVVAGTLLYREAA